MKASASVQTKNTAAHTAVERDRKFALPRGAEEAARGAAAEGGAHVGPLAVLDQHEADHGQRGQQLHCQHEVHPDLHGGSLSPNGMGLQPAARQMATKSAAFNDAPPIRPPSMSGCANSVAALSGLTLPP